MLSLSYHIISNYLLLLKKNYQYFKKIDPDKEMNRLKKNPLKYLIKHDFFICLARQ